MPTKIEYGTFDKDGRTYPIMRLIWDDKYQKSAKDTLQLGQKKWGVILDNIDAIKRFVEVGIPDVKTKEETDLGF
jgi:hypothetical protein